MCVCVWTFSIEVKLVRFLLQGAQAHCGYLCQRSYSTMGEAKIDHLRVPAEHLHGDETVLWLPSFLSLESCCLEFAWNNHYHELGTERAISLIQVCILWWMSDKVPQGQGFDPEQPLSRGKHDWEKLNVEFTFFNLVIRLSNLPRVLLICQPFQMCISRVVVVE